MSFCREKDTSVVDSRPCEEGKAVRRRRLCTCHGGMRFTTFERIQFQELTVIKGSGKRALLIEKNYLSLSELQHEKDPSMPKPLKTLFLK